MIKRYFLFFVIIIFGLNSCLFNKAFAISQNEIDEYLKGNLHLDENDINKYLNKEFGFNRKDIAELKELANKIMEDRINNYPYFKNVRWISTKDGRTAYCDIDIAHLEIDIVKSLKKPVSIKASDSMVTIEIDKDFNCKGMLMNIRKGAYSKIWPLPKGSKGFKKAIESIFNGDSNLGVLLLLMAEVM